MKIRRATAEDAGRIAQIYNWYVLNTVNTFETEAVGADEMQRRIDDKLPQYEWLVGEAEDVIVGYAYYGPFRTRAAYRHTVESTVYLDREYFGKGYGRALYARLFESVKQRGFREVMGVIGLPNPASVALHRAMGFVQVGLLKNVGYKFDRYIDVGFWQLSLAG